MLIAEATDSVIKGKRISPCLTFIFFRFSKASILYISSLGTEKNKKAFLGSPLASKKWGGMYIVEEKF